MTSEAASVEDREVIEFEKSKDFCATRLADDDAGKICCALCIVARFFCGELFKLV